MRFPRKRGSTSNIVTIFIPDNSSTTGAGLATLTSASANLVVGYRREFDSTYTEYKQSAGNIEAQTTIGTYQAPSTSAKCRIKHDARGKYEIQFHNDATIFNTGDLSKSVIIEVYEETSAALKIGPNAVLIPLSKLNPLDGECDLTYILGTLLTETAGQIAAAFKKFFDKAAPTGTINSLPDAVAGANGGLPTTNGTKISQTVDLTAGQTPTNFTAMSITVGGLVAVPDTQKVDVNTIKTQAVTCSAGVTIGVYVGNATAALSVDASGRVDIIKVAGTTQTAGDIYTGIVDLRKRGFNKLEVTDASGAYTLYDDNNSTPLYTGTITDNSTTTTRTKMA